MLGNKIDFSSCAIWTGFHKSSHILFSKEMLYLCIARQSKFTVQEYIFVCTLKLWLWYYHLMAQV